MGNRLAILLVEDDHEDAVLVRELLAEGMAGQAYELHHVGTLRDAEACARAQAPDLVLLDLLLPDSGGTATVHAMHAAAPGSRIIVLTGYDAPSLARECIRAGAWDYLPKSSLEPEALARAVVSGIGKARERGQTTR